MNILDVIDKATDLINPRISPQHADWNQQLRQVHATVLELISFVERVAQAEVGGYGQVLGGPGPTEAQELLDRCKGEA